MNWASNNIAVILFFVVGAVCCHVQSYNWVHMHFAKVDVMRINHHEQRGQGSDPLCGPAEHDPGLGLHEACREGTELT